MIEHEPALADLAPEVAPFFTGYRIDLEPRKYLAERLKLPTELWMKACRDTSWEAPKEIDPREWFDIHNQGNQGSCQGQSLADAAEFAYLISHGEEIQLSRSFAYLGSQEKDGLLGRDAGSTLNGGTWAASRGLPLESVFPYDVNYRSAVAKYQSQKSTILAGDLYKLNGEVRIRTSDEAKAFLGGWTGCVQIGIDWSVRLTNGWEIKSYSPGRSGGHAIDITGYLDVNSWEEGYGLLLKNSHSTQWGRDGWALVKPSAFNDMMRAQWSVGIGRSDMVAPKPRIDRIDHARAFGVAK